MPQSAVVTEAIQRCRNAGLRRTRALEQLLATLAESDRPMTLAELTASPRLADQCDKATVFRLLHRLVDRFTFGFRVWIKRRKAGILSIDQKILSLLS